LRREIWICDVCGVEIGPERYVVEISRVLPMESRAVRRLKRLDLCHGCKVSLERDIERMKKIWRSGVDE